MCCLHYGPRRPCKICDWLWNSSQNHIDLHQGKKTQSDHRVRAFQKTYFKAYIIYWHGPRRGCLRAFDYLWRHIDVSEPVASEVCSLLIMTSYDLSNAHEWHVCVFFVTHVHGNSSQRKGACGGPIWCLVFKWTPIFEWCMH